LEGRTERHAIDGLHALNFVAHGGGVSRSLCLDNYGEALSAALLGFELDIPDNLGGHLRGLDCSVPHRGARWLWPQAPGRLRRVDDLADEANLARRGRDAPHFRNFDVSISVSD
jgi:hypothetical protein